MRGNAEFSRIESELFAVFQIRERTTYEVYKQVDVYQNDRYLMNMFIQGKFG